MPDLQRQRELQVLRWDRSEGLSGFLALSQRMQLIPCGVTLPARGPRYRLAGTHRANEGAANARPRDLPRQKGR